MKPQNFKIRAEGLLKQLDEIQANMENKSSSVLYNPYPDLHKMILNFVYLVYAFDPNLPLNQLISDLPNMQFGHKIFGNDSHNREKFNEIRYYMNFFIQYLEDYYE